MIISHNDFERVCVELLGLQKGTIVLDFETTGLFADKGDTAFLMSFIVNGGEPMSVWLQDMPSRLMQLFCMNDTCTYIAHNAKFEMTFLKVQFGAEIKGKIWDTEVMARIQYNQHMSYSLDNCGERIGIGKYQLMKEFLHKNGKDAYSKAPPEIIVPYCEQDCVVSQKLFEDQCATFIEWKNSDKSVRAVVELEQLTTKNLFAMERSGLLVDIGYCEKALEHDQSLAAKALETFKELTGEELVDSAKALEPIFTRLGLERANKDSFDWDSIQGIDHPVVKAILDHREYSKRANTYWKNFIDLSAGSVIHPNIGQGRARTGRLTCNDPNAQNWPASDGESAYPIRRSFIARPECKIVSIDYKQMEYRKLADEAADLEVIQMFINKVDLHQVAADIAGCSRKHAKNVRFARLYGAGPAKLAKMLSISIEEVKRIIEAIDQTAQGIAAYTRGLTKSSKLSGEGTNWLGRRYFFPKLTCTRKDGTKYIQETDYTYPNYRIQGGCADILRVAINKVYKVLADRKSPLTMCLIPIHDELVFNIHESDMDLIPRIAQAMRDADLMKDTLGMDVDIAIGDNFHDLTEYEIDAK